MAGQIRMSPEAMRDKAKQYEDQGGVVNGVIGTLDKLLAALQSEWEGTASESYGARYGELRPSFVQAEQLINDIAQALKATAQVVEQADADIAKQFRA